MSALHNLQGIPARDCRQSLVPVCSMLLHVRKNPVVLYHNGNQQFEFYIKTPPTAFLLTHL